MKKIILYFWKILPFIMLITFMFLIYYVYVFEYLYLMKNNYNIFKNIFFFNIFRNNYKICFYSITILISIIFIIILRIIISDPGNIPLDWHNKNYDLIINELVEIKNKDKNLGLFSNLITIETLKKVNNNDKDFKELLLKKNLRFCKVCKILKPPRAYHCKQCYKCVLKMDHHCNWVLNCIGLKNYKFFLQLIFYIEIALIFNIYTITETLILSYYSKEILPKTFFLISFVYIISIFMLCLVSFLFGFHFFRLTTKNMTTIEFCEKKEKYSYYDKGALKNLKDIFGLNPILWWLPICNNIKENKLGFETNNEELVTINTMFKN